MTEQPPILEVCHKGVSWMLVPGGVDSLSHFGGPHMVHIESAVDLESAFLHHVATINLPKFGAGISRFGFSVPLLYGICHEGCEIEYSKTATSAVEITRLDPEEASEDYPYPGYPSILPCYGLGIGEQTEYKPGYLEARLANTAWEIRAECLYIIVMEHPSIGHCLFEPGGDVEIVFEYEPTRGKVRATNQCS